MIKLDTAKITYYSQLDEAQFFRWAKKIPCVESIDGGYFHIKSEKISDSDLLDLIAIMYRYSMPMKQLKIFCNPSNDKWFKKSGMYWYKKVFGK